MMPEIKKEITTVLKRLGVVSDKDTGYVEIHINDGGISKIYKKVEVK